MHSKCHIYGLTAILCVLLLCSCKDNVYFTAHHHFEQSVWYSEDTIKIPVAQFLTYEQIDSGTVMNLSISLRHSDKYKYRTLYVEAVLTDTTGTVRQDTLRFDISARGGDGFRYRTQVKEWTQFVPLDSNRYTISITHIMKQNPLEGISDLIVGCDSEEK